MVMMAVMRLMVMAVMVMMRRVRQRDVRQKNQCKREADKFTHELDPLTLMNGYTPR